MTSPAKTDPRRRRSRDRILAAAWELFGRDGFPALTVERIAEHSGVAKTTIYRQWPNKAAVLMDALLAELEPRTPFPDTGSARQDLRQQLTAVIDLLGNNSAGSAYLALVAEGQHDPHLAEQLRERYLAARRSDATTVLTRGMTRGELRADLNTDIVIDTLYGALYYRFLVSHTVTGADYADALLNQFFRALTPDPRPSGGD